MVEELPEVVSRVRLHRDRVTVFTPDAQIQDVDMFYADITVYDVLKRKIIAVATTFYFSYTASLRNPVDALKYE